ncbi:MAG: hypothetical protein SNJ53_03770, partial [Thermodesulfovibrionales bacterium]
FAGCSSNANQMACYKIDSDTEGCLETVDNIANLTIVSIDDNVFKAEYEAGFIQGRLQRSKILSARDNLWDTAYLIDPSHTFPRKSPPSKDELALARQVLLDNYQYTLNYMQSTNNHIVARNMRRILYRMIGIYHGATENMPLAITFDSTWVPAWSASELELNYESSNLTFMDIYFVNAFPDLIDVIDNIVSDPLDDDPDKCSAFVKKTEKDIIITHNSWFSYLSQSMVLSLYVNGDYLSINAITPGIVGSSTDFGYNNKGIMFNETTHRATYTEPKTKALWMFWRATLAEQFASSMDEFYYYLSLEPSGTYMNGYMIVDTNTRQIGLVEMSYKSFVYFKPDNAGGYLVITKPEGLSTEYDKELLQPDYILGINYPVSRQIVQDLKAADNRPARKRQFMQRIGNVTDVESAKLLITYTDPQNPLSIYGRWDLGYGETPSPKTVPDGSIDAKVVSASMIDYTRSLKGIYDRNSTNKAFWMKYGTPIINGKPFIWSESQWRGQKLRDVPDVVDGSYNLLNTYIR